MLAFLAMWILFSVVLGLSHFGLNLGWRRAHKLPIHLDIVLADGGLFFFAVPLATVAYGECQMARFWANHPLSNGIAVAFLIIIVTASTTAYSAIWDHHVVALKMESSKTDPDWDPKFIGFASKWTAITAIVYAALLTALRYKG